MSCFRWILYLLLFVFAVSCEDSKRPFQEKPSENERVFPKLINFPQTDVQIDTTEQLQSRVYPVFISKRKDVDYNSVGEIKNLRYNFNDSIEFAQVKKIDVYVDVNQPFQEKFFELSHIGFWSEDENGKRISLYDSIMKLPVFVINLSDSNQVVENHDRRLVMIQEAKDQSGEWKPVEYFQYSGCGNSTGHYLIEKGGVLMFGVNMYKGDFKTVFRVRFVSNGEVFFSNEYHGEINLEQFEFDEGEHGWSWNKYLKQDQYDELK